MTYKFTNRANKAIEIANDIALELGHSYIGTEHILYGLAKEGNGIASKVLENQNVTADDILNKIEELIGRDEPIENIVDFTPRTKRVVESAFIEARKLGYSKFSFGPSTENAGAVINTGLYSYKETVLQQKSY